MDFLLDFGAKTRWGPLEVYANEVFLIIVFIIRVYIGTFFSYTRARVCLQVYLSVCLFVCFFVCQFVYLSVCLYIYIVKALDSLVVPGLNPRRGSCNRRDIALWQSVDFATTRFEPDQPRSAGSEYLPHTGVQVRAKRSWSFCFSACTNIP